MTVSLIGSSMAIGGIILRGSLSIIVVTTGGVGMSSMGSLVGCSSGGLSSSCSLNKLPVMLAVTLAAVMDEWTEEDSEELAATVLLDIGPGGGRLIDCRTLPCRPLVTMDLENAIFGEGLRNEAT